MIPKSNTSNKRYEHSEHNASFLDHTFDGPSFLSGWDSFTAADKSPTQEKILLMKQGKADTQTQIQHHRPNSAQKHKQLKEFPPPMTKSPSRQNRSFTVKVHAQPTHNKTLTYDNSRILDRAVYEKLPSMKKNALLEVQFGTELQSTSASKSKPEIGIGRSRKLDNNPEDAHQRRLVNVYQQKQWLGPMPPNFKSNSKRRRRKFREEVSEGDILNLDAVKPHKKDKHKKKDVEKNSPKHDKERRNFPEFGHRKIISATKLNHPEKCVPGGKENTPIIIEPSILEMHPEEMDQWQYMRMRASSVPNRSNVTQETREGQNETIETKNGVQTTEVAETHTNTKQTLALPTKPVKASSTIDVSESRSTKLESEKTTLESKVESKVPNRYSSPSREKQQNSSSVIKGTCYNQASIPKIKDLNKKYSELMNTLDITWKFRELQGMIKKGRKRSVAPKKVSWNGN